MDDKAVITRKLQNIGRNEPIPIKIELDMKEKYDEIKKNGDLNEKSTQTGNPDILSALKKIVCQQIAYHKEKWLNIEYQHKCYDELFVKNLLKENEQLKKQANILNSKLEELEKNSLKRRPRSVPPSSRPLKIPNKSGPPPLMNGNDISSENPQMYVTQQQNIPIAPKEMTVNHFKTPVQMVPPVQQAQRMQNNEQFFFVDSSQIIGNAFAGNTQVVAANQGLRMTSIPPGLRMQTMNSSNMFSNMPTRVQGFHNQNMRGSILWRQPQQQQIQLLQQQQQQQKQQQQQQTQQRLMEPKMLSKTQTILKPTPVNNPIQLQQVPNLVKPLCLLPKLKASITANGSSGIILTWDYDPPNQNPSHFKVECYQLFAHQAKDACVKPPQDIKQWKKIGVVNALPLPMACTLTQFATGNVYFFAVVAVDIHGREGEISNPCIIRLHLNS